MSDAVDVLEALGSDARFHTGSGDEVARELAHADVDPLLKAAILASDPGALRAALGLTSMVGLIMPAEEEEEGEGEGEKEDAPRPDAPSSIARGPAQ